MEKLKLVKGFDEIKSIWLLDEWTEFREERTTH